MKNKYKSLVLLLSAIFLVLAILPFIYAENTFGCYFNIPNATSLVLSNNWTINATITSLYTNANVTNCTFYAQDVSTNATAYATLFTDNNVTDDQLKFGYAYNTTALEDGSNYTFKMVCVNVTTPIGTTWAKNNCTNTTDVSAGIANISYGRLIVNNTVPDAPTALSPSNQQITTTNTVTFSGTVSDAKTTGCRLRLGVLTYNMTYSGSSCTLTLSNIPRQVYQWYISATDGSDTISSGVYDVDVKVQHGSKAGAALQQAGYQPTGGATFAVGTTAENVSMGNFLTSATVRGIPNFLWLILAIGIIGGYIYTKRRH